MGKSPAVDDNHIIDDISYMTNVVAKTADYTVLAKETGTLFTTEGATGAVTFTLPTIADGLSYKFINAEDVDMTVTGTANLMVAFNDAEATSVAFSTDSAKVGGWVEVVSDGTKWMAMTGGTGNTLSVS